MHCKICGKDDSEHFINKSMALVAENAALSVVVRVLRLRSLRTPSKDTVDGRLSAVPAFSWLIEIRRSPRAFERAKSAALRPRGLAHARQQDAYTPVPR